jgi:hypothetical protein
VTPAQRADLGWWVDVASTEGCGLIGRCYVVAVDEATHGRHLCILKPWGNAPKYPPPADPTARYRYLGDERHGGRWVDPWRILAAYPPEAP